MQMIRRFSGSEWRTVKISDSAWECRCRMIYAFFARLELPHWNLLSNIFCFVKAVVFSDADVT